MSVALPNELSVTISSSMKNTHVVDNFIELVIDRFQLPEFLRARFTVAIVKAVHNSIIHGNKENPKKKVIIAAVKRSTEVLVTVEDQGKGFAPDKLPDFTQPECFSLYRLPRGLYLMSTLSDRILFEKNGAKVIMAFLLN